MININSFNDLSWLPLTHAPLDLAAVLLLALGIKGLGKVRSARAANRLAALALAIAVLGLLLQQGLQGWPWLLAGAVAGSLLGVLVAQKAAMTAMPQLVALFNGCGGMASLLVALAAAALPTQTGLLALVSIVVSVLVGGITFSGSLVAMAKLQEWLQTPAWMLQPARHWVNGLTAASALALGWWVCSGHSIALLPLALLSLLLGVGLTLPIGGADMPVVISLLNSYSGVAAAAAGFVVGSELLIVAGAMVGTAGLILTQVMCNAMTLEQAQRVVFVPGYGLAVAQAQHSLKEVAQLLERHGVEVSYAIHPVAGRMPGHMNVLLAEADVPYDQLIEMEAINPDFPRTDVVIVLGANDVVNPQARTDASSPLFGMPVLHVEEAATVFVVKRSLGAGYAGIRNSLFECPNTSMIFGDAKQVLNGLAQELRELGVGKTTKDLAKVA